MESARERVCVCLAAASFDFLVKSGVGAVVGVMNVEDDEELFKCFCEACIEHEERRTSDEELYRGAEFTDRLPLASYSGLFTAVPRVVNVVTLSEGHPVHGCVPQTTLPFDLHEIASRVNCAFYAPQLFAAVQVSFSAPRSRVLIFHTGRIVGTGSSSIESARLALVRVQRVLAEEANIYIEIRNFSAVNVVSAASIGAKFGAENFAQGHVGNAHYDDKSFVGLAWRPRNEAVSAEVYGTGRVNLPGGKRFVDVCRSWSRMVPELLRYSSAPSLAKEFSVSDQEACRGGGPDPTAAADAQQGLWLEDSDGLHVGGHGDDDDDSNVADPASFGEDEDALIKELMSRSDLPF